MYRQNLLNSSFFLVFSFEHFEAEWQFFATLPVARKLINNLQVEYSTFSQTTKATVAEPGPLFAAITGTSEDDVFVATDIADDYDGLGGVDTVDYSASDAAVLVDLLLGTGSSAFAEGDTYVSIENVIGTFSGDRIIGSDEINDLRGGDGHDYITGNGGDDWIYGDGGNDLLVGNGHKDRLFGGTGDDRLFGLSGNDALYGNTGNDVMGGGLGNDVLYGHAGADILDGGIGNDILRGGIGNDILRGGADNDRLFGGVGDDRLYGDSGNDRLYGMADNDTLYGGAGDDVIGGGSGNDEQHGEDGDDIVDGGVGNDTLFGGAGNDRLVGGTGNDTLDGGAGDDRIFGGDGADTVVLSGNFIDDYTVDIDGVTGVVTITDNVGTDGVDTLFDIEFLQVGSDEYLLTPDGLFQGTVLTENDDAFTAGNAVVQVHGLGGADEIIGGASGDVIYGGEGDDRLLGSDTSFDFTPPSPVERYTDAHDSGDDVIFGGNGNDIIYGHDGSDVLYGDAGNDFISGGGNSDIIYGGAGNDNIVDIYDYYYRDNDQNFGNDVIYGGDGDDTIRTNIGFNRLYGGAGNDELFGGSVLDGGTGDDILAGGRDTVYIFDVTNGGHDTIVGFRSFPPYTYQTINLVGNDPDFDTFEEIMAVSSILGSDLVFDFGNGNTLTLQNTGITGFSQNNYFIFGPTGVDVELSDDATYAEAYFGTEYDDSINGLAGDDRLFGEGGDDSLIGGSGDDLVEGGSGDDTIAGNSGDDTLSGGSGDDTIFGGSGIDTLVLSGSDLSNYSFSLNADTSVVTITDNVGDDGTDTVRDVELVQINDIVHDIETVVGVSFGDNLNLTSGEDTYEGSEFSDNVRGLAGNDTLSGNFGDDLLYGDEGFDTLQGDEGNDTLYGGSGNDTLDGGDGSDTLDGGTGTDVAVLNENLYYYHLGIIWDVRFSYVYDQVTGILTLTNLNGNTDTLTGIEFIRFDDITVPVEAFFGEHVDLTTNDANYTGTQYADFISSSELGSTIHGGDGGDVIIGSYGDDLLFGDAGDDIIIGNAGDDILNGGTGNDILTGHRGRDTYVYDVTQGGQDTIIGYAVNLGREVINLTGNDSRFDTYAEVRALAERDGANTIIDFGDGNVLTLRNVTPGELTENDFTFNGAAELPVTEKAAVAEPGSLFAAITGTSGDDVLVATATDDDSFVFVEKAVVSDDLDVNGFDDLLGPEGINLADLRSAFLGAMEHNHIDRDAEFVEDMDGDFFIDFWL